MSKQALCIHAHFSQPARIHPVSGIIGREHSAAPYRNWNERALAEIYRPNVELKNFHHLSFDIGESLLAWLQSHALAVYDAIIGAIQYNQEKSGVGNVLASSLHASPLPLLPRKAQLTQLIWGASTAQAHYGYVPQGVFLPEYAADESTLQAALDAGFQFTLLKASQVEGLPHRGGAGPYRLELPSGDVIGVYVVNETLSNSMYHELVERGGAGFWTRRKLIPHHRQAGPLTLLAINGEDLGRHRMSEAHFIHYLLDVEARAVSFRPTTLAEHFESIALEQQPTITRLSYQRPEESKTQSLLRDALHDLMTEVEIQYEEAVGKQAQKQLWYALHPDSNANQNTWVQAQLMLHQAWAGIAHMEREVAISIDQIMSQVAYAIMLLNTQVEHIDLESIFTERFPSEARSLFNHTYQLVESEYTQPTTRV